jgi:hypothetical protein
LRTSLAAPKSDEGGILAGVRVKALPRAHPQLNWIELLTSDQKVAGSSPAGCAKIKEFRMVNK